MSVWTHVIGTFTMYDVPKEDSNVWRKKILKRLYRNLGRPSRYLENNKTIVPKGSEGSLHWTLQKVNMNGDIPIRYRGKHVESWLQDHDRYAYVVSIFGDLRDYQNLTEIEEWFKNIIYEPRYDVRDGFLKADCGDGNEIAISYNFDEKCKRNEEFDKMIEEWL